MKKIVTIAFGCMALLTWISTEGFAVWPSQASLQDETKSPARQDLSLAERFEVDVRRLDDAVKDLKQDHRDLITYCSDGYRQDDRHSGDRVDCQQELKQTQEKSGTVYKSNPPPSGE